MWVYGTGCIGGADVPPSPFCDPREHCGMVANLRCCALLVFLLNDRTRNAYLQYIYVLYNIIFYART